MLLRLCFFVLLSALYAYLARSMPIAITVLNIVFYRSQAQVFVGEL